MTPLTVFVLLFVCYCDSLSIRTVRDKKVTNDAKDATGNFYPDWVPFKNKHGDELGEFKPVPKAKPKKRLALPVNFVMRSIAEPSGDYYFDKGQGDSDNEDYYEKKEWSDLNRNAKQVDPDKAINITSVDTSDIEGIINIITKPVENPIVDLIQGKNETKSDNVPEPEVEEKKAEIKEEPPKVEEEKKETEDSDTITINDNIKEDKLEEKQENDSGEEDEEEESKSNKNKDEPKSKEKN